MTKIQPLKKINFQSPFYRIQKNTPIIPLISTHLRRGYLHWLAVAIQWKVKHLMRQRCRSQVIWRPALSSQLTTDRLRNPLQLKASKEMSKINSRSLAKILTQTKEAYSPHLWYLLLQQRSWTDPPPTTRSRCSTSLSMLKIPENTKPKRPKLLSYRDQRRCKTLTSDSWD